MKIVCRLDFCLINTCENFADITIYGKIISSTCNKFVNLASLNANFYKIVMTFDYKTF